MNFYKKITKLKNENEAFRHGAIEFVDAKENYIKYMRTKNDKTFYVEISLNEKLQKNRNSILFVESDYVCADVYVVKQKIYPAGSKL